MKTILFLLWAFCLVPSLPGAEQCSSDTGQEEKNTVVLDSPITLSIRGERYCDPVSPDSPVSFVFKNQGKTPIYLLDLFKVYEEHFLTLSLTIRDDKGEKVLNYVPCIKLGLRQPLKYVDLLPGGIYLVSFPLSKFIKNRYPEGLPKGEYTLTGEYENQFGRNCFKGKLVSPPVKFTVEE
ncbi:MAG: hypothetical protein KHX31_06030 [Akkermansia sp.]|uniref:hypothetical protein n=1 Tax=Akkermansia sp. TaxID=1872421 RepID=UPI0025C56E45|nr:hypothetical protein [Akkermansia sp.]MBS5508176.1 hypothetical protein [Akkermansia sp.]